MTTRIVISGRKPVLLKISLDYLLQNEARLSLSDAHRVVANIEREEPVEIDIADEKATSFIEKADELGAIAYVHSPSDDAKEAS